MILNIFSSIHMRLHFWETPIYGFFPQFSFGLFITLKLFCILDTHLFLVIFIVNILHSFVSRWAMQWADKDMFSWKAVATAYLQPAVAMEMWIQCDSLLQLKKWFMQNLSTFKCCPDVLFSMKWTNGPT